MEPRKKEKSRAAGQPWLNSLRKIYQVSTNCHQFYYNYWTPLRNGIENWLLIVTSFSVFFYCLYDLLLIANIGVSLFIWLIQSDIGKMVSLGLFNLFFYISPQLVLLFLLEEFWSLTVWRTGDYILQLLRLSL
jgi:hypothetical protein